MGRGGRVASNRRKNGEEKKVGKKKKTYVQVRKSAGSKSKKTGNEGHGEEFELVQKFEVKKGGRKPKSDCKLKDRVGQT